MAATGSIAHSSFRATALLQGSGPYRHSRPLKEGLGEKVLDVIGATRRIRTDDLLITNKHDTPNTANDPEKRLTKSRDKGD
jgi:hypothetical protein